jgi:hypothetical protein
LVTNSAQTAFDDVVFESHGSEYHRKMFFGEEYRTYDQVFGQTDGRAEVRGDDLDQKRDRPYSRKPNLVQSVHDVDRKIRDCRVQLEKVALIEVDGEDFSETILVFFRLPACDRF